MNVLVIDIGGSHVKMLVTGGQEPRRFDSGKHLGPDEFVAEVRKMTTDWRYEVVALGYPGTVDVNGPIAEPGNLSDGWVRYDFASAFGCPVRVVNDATLQALGAYAGGRMLFLGLGTGLGAALIIERVVIPLELGCLPSGAGQSLGDVLGKNGLAQHGRQAWVQDVNEAVGYLGRSFMADYIVLGGGNATQVDPLPAGVRRGGNDDAFTGGFRLWEEQVEPHDQTPSGAWRVVR